MDDRELRIRPAAAGEEGAMSDLVCRVFERHVAKLYSAEGQATFRGFASAASFAARAATSAWWVAALGERIVGVLEIREGTHVAMLFVESELQRRGVGARLLEGAFGPRGAWPQLTVNSAPNAVGVYERLGFAAIGETLVKDGIVYLPMTRPADGG